MGSIGLSLSDLYNVNPTASTGGRDAVDPNAVPIMAVGKSSKSSAPAMSWLGLVIGLVMIRVLWEYAD